MCEVGRQLDLTRLEALPAETRRSKRYDSRRKTYDLRDRYMVLLDLSHTHTGFEFESIELYFLLKKTSIS